MYRKGITLISVVVMIIIMIIIATVSILAGNKMITNSRELADKTMVETVKEAIMRRNSEIKMQGTVTPLGSSYPGQLSPYIADGLIEAEGWYLLNEEALDELGVKKSKERYLVNYKTETVLALTDPDYVEKYLVCVYMQKQIEQMKKGEINYYYGSKALHINPGSSMQSSTFYYRETDKYDTEVFANGWYFVSSGTIKEVIQEDYPDTNLENVIVDDFLVNFEDFKFEKVTSDFKVNNAFPG